MTSGARKRQSKKHRIHDLSPYFKHEIIFTISEGAASEAAGVVVASVPLPPPRIPPITSPKSPRS